MVAPRTIVTALPPAPVSSPRYRRTSLLAAPIGNCVASAACAARAGSVRPVPDSSSVTLQDGSDESSAATIDPELPAPTMRASLCTTGAAKMA